MKKTALLLGLHCHQPVDNFDWVMQEAIQKSYKPFFEEVLKYKEFKFSIHYSGWLLEYIKQNDTELFSMMQEACENKQVEFLTGGFYEPILASIPSKDRVKQIKKLNKFIKKNFNQTPKGLWLTERVWESSIIEDLDKCGIEYVIVDDYHFISAGFDKNSLNGYYITEEGGKEMKIFPINKTLRYILPFKPSLDVVSYLESLADENISAGVIFDDGEKFGIWPKTYEWVYEKGWLRDFIEKVLKNDTIESMQYKEYIKRNRPLGIAYLPSTSYFEMGEWSLKADDAVSLDNMKTFLQIEGTDENSIEKFVKGTIWKNFLVKYSESNRIHKRVLELSKNRVDSKRYKENLYKSQTNDVLWHGVFGGLYLPNLRDNAYRFIIECENIRYKDDKNKVEIKDINLDGFEEAKLVSEELLMIFDAKNGAQMTEFDLRDKRFNFQNTLTRYKEAYHEKILKDDLIQEHKEDDGEGIDTIHSVDIEEFKKYKPLLKFDWYIKNSFIDHISDGSFTLENFDRCTFNEYGDFANQPFEIKKLKKGISFKREGGIYKAGVKYPTTIEKSFSLQKECLEFDIALNSENQDDFFYVQEYNFHFASLDDIRIDGNRFEKANKIECIREFEIEDFYTEKKIVFSFERDVDLYFYPLDTLSQSESGFEPINQALTFAVSFRFNQAFDFGGKIKILPLGE